MSSQKSVFPYQAITNISENNLSLNNSYTWHSIRCFFKYVSFNTQGSPAREKAGSEKMISCADIQVMMDLGF